VVGEVEIGKPCVPVAEELMPAVVPLAVAMSVMPGIDAAPQLIAEAPHPEVIVGSG
jgi:DNA-binding NarL/FixJ family response regulator